MRILVHGISYAPELIATGKYTGEMAEWLARKDHEVRVITAPPYYPEWKVRKGYSAWKYRKEVLDRVTVFRCPLWVPKEPKALSRILQQVSFAISSLPLMIAHAFWKPDIVIVVEPPLLCAPQALLTARLSCAKAWLHIQDYEVEAFYGLGFNSNLVIKSILVRLESTLMRGFDMVSSISRTMLQRARRFNVREEHSMLFPNWVDIDKMRPDATASGLRSEWKIASDKRIVLYAGNMGKKQGLEVVLDAAADLESERPDVFFLMVGGGAAKDQLEALARRKKLHNILFKPLLPLDKLPSLLSIADVHLVIQKRVLRMRLCRQN